MLRSCIHIGFSTFDHFALSTRIKKRRESEKGKRKEKASIKIIAALALSKRKSLFFTLLNYCRTSIKQASK
jgi:hypothetical protein